jgi:SNF2 family DNA or RNA helicase
VFVFHTVFESAKIVFKAALQDGDDNALSHRSIFEVLTRLRQACCCGSLVPIERLEAAERVLEIATKKGGTLTAEEGKELLEKLKGALESDETTPECAICLEGMDESAAVVLRGCGHVFCQICISKVSMGHHSNCPFCRHAFLPDDMIKFSAAVAASAADEDSNGQLKLSQVEHFGPSPKMEALLQAIKEMKPGEKAVIFSQFTKFLDRVETFLKEKGCDLARIDGKKTGPQRIKAMKSFAEDGGPDFMLCSLHAAGTGINLTRANHIMMMDTWWNSSVEMQAFDRVHRIGQQKAVRVIRFVAAHSIESRMVDLQEAKAALSKGTFENLSNQEKKKARMGEVKRLLELG